MPSHTRKPVRTRLARIVIEADGGQHRGWLASLEDERRDARLRALGYQVIRVSWHMLTREPELFVASVRAALTAAGAFSA